MNNENNEAEDTYEEHLDSSEAIRNSLLAVNFDTSLDYAEIGLDAFLTHEVLKEVPIVKTIVGVVKSGLKVREIFFAKKVLTFLKDFHTSKIDPGKYQEFKQIFSDDKAYRDKVMEQIMVFNDKFVHVEKSKILANLFAAHVNGHYVFDRFISFAMSVELLNIYAINYLHEMAKFKNPFRSGYNRDTAAVPLLAGAGLVEVYNEAVFITEHGMFIYHYGIEGKVDEELNGSDKMDEAMRGGGVRD